MNRKDAVLDALNGNREDIPPAAVFTQTATVSQMERCGSRWPEANYDPDMMCELALECSRSFGFSTVRVPFCVSIEAERLGCAVDRGSIGSQPSVISSPYRMEEGFSDVPEDLMSPAEFVSGGRCTVVSGSVHSLAEKHGDDLVVVAGITGPLTTLTHVLGAENLLMGMVLCPERVYGWLDAVTPMIKTYAETLAHCGADDIQVTEGSASPDLTPPHDFERFAGGRLRSIFSGIGCKKSLHICGEAYEILDGMVSTGADALSIEKRAGVGHAVERVGGRAVLIGCVDPVGTLLSGTPADVVTEARACADCGFGIIAPGCGVPPMTPDDNLNALAHYDGM